MDKHCIVKDCNNVSNEMTFYNGVCAECYMFLAHGAGDGQVYRNMIKVFLRRLFNYLKATDESFDEVLPEPPPVVAAPPESKPTFTEVPPPAAAKRKKKDDPVWYGTKLPKVELWEEPKDNKT